MDSLLFLDLAGIKLPLSVLIVQINRQFGENQLVNDHAERAVSELQRGLVDVGRVTNLDDGLKVLAARHFDALVLDLPLLDDSSLIDLARVHALFPATPIVVLTNFTDGELVLQVLRNGAQDCISRDNLAGVDLVRAVRFAVERGRLEKAKLQAFKGDGATAKRIIEFSPIATAKMSTRLFVTEANQAFVEGFSYLGENLKGKRIFNFIPQLPVVCFEKVLRTAKPCRIANFEVRVGSISRERSEYWDIAIWPIKDSRQDIVTGLILIAANVTERVERTQEMEALNMAMMNEMKVPLIGSDRVLSAIANGQFGELSEKLEEAILKLRGSNQKMISMVSNLLYVHKDEVAESKPYIAIQDLVDIVASCLQELEPFFVERNLTASIKIADDCNFVYCDSFCLHRVLINLLHNACTHAQYGSEIVLSADLDSDNALVLQVIDDGDGVDPELLPSLFERVTQTRSATRKPSGLGLYVAARIVESAGGSIACISAPFAGATFRVRLPNKKP